MKPNKQCYPGQYVNHTFFVFLDIWLEKRSKSAPLKSARPRPGPRE
jgi:hypothetical protein